jgi:hypothetical protein
MNPSITATNPTLIPAISFPPFAPPFFVLDACGALVVAVPVLAAPALPVESVCPILGNLTSPSTNQPPGVELGQAGGVSVGAYAELATPVGVKVAHWLCKFV